MFSVIMPVWNRADCVSLAIESVLGQSYKDYELLIIDDGSEDNLEGVVRQYLSEKVIYHRISHSGACAARNYALKKARFPLIAYLDSDNRWHPEYLATMHQALQGNSTKYHVAYCQANRYRKNQLTGEPDLDGTIGKCFSFSELLAGNYIDINTFVHSRKALEQIGLFDEKLKRLTDWDLIIRATSLFEPVFVPEVLVDYYLCFADNALSLIEDVERADRYVRRKHSALREPVTLLHDGTPYTWEKLPQKKYENWIRINRVQFNTDEYAAWGYPYMLQIEPTNTCNLECPLCPVGRKQLGRKARHMPVDEFKKIVDDMNDYLMLLVLWDWGEPFMHPALPEMIRYASEYDIRTVTSTNAQFLNNEEYVEDILKSGLSTLIVAIDSVCEESYKVYRKKGVLSDAISGLEKVVQMKKRLESKTIINFRTVVMKQNEHELKKLEKLARKVGVDRFTVKTLNPGCGSTVMDNELLPRSPRYRRFKYKSGTFELIRTDKPCPRPWMMANILSNGDVVPCTYDYNSSMKLGNVRDRPFTDIWNSQNYVEFRKRLSNDMESFEKCGNCWVNFELSKSGWFPIIVDFNESALSRLRKNANEFLHRLPGKRVLKAIWK